MKTLSMQRPLPSMARPDTALEQLIGEVLAGELAALVGVEVSGPPCRISASSSASMQKEVSMQLDKRQASTRRECQSMMAKRIGKAAGQGNVSDVGRSDLVGPAHRHLP